MTTTNRRTVLSFAGLAAAATGLGAAAGCTAETPRGDGAPTGASTGAPTTGSTAPGSTGSAPSSTGSAPASSTAPGPGSGVSVADVPEGGGFVQLEGDYVFTQPTAGEFKAFDKLCTHQGCPVANVTDGTINCNCHGSKFSISDGSVVQGPADQPLAESPVTVSGEELVVG